jgi:hypothetical protein
VLGHRSLATTERHYNLATSLKAARNYQVELQRLRSPKFDLEEEEEEED